MIYLRATTIKAAKIQAKLHFHDGGTIYGYKNELGISRLVYICFVGERNTPGKRICYSDGNCEHRSSTPHFFKFIRSNGHG